MNPRPQNLDFRLAFVSKKKKKKFFLLHFFGWEWLRADQAPPSLNHLSMGKNPLKKIILSSINQKKESKDERKKKFQRKGVTTCGDEERDREGGRKKKRELTLTLLKYLLSFVPC